MKKVIIILVLLGVIFGGFYAYKLYNKPHENIEKAAISQHFSMERLFDLFSKDNKSVDTELFQKVVSVEGNVKSIDKAEKQYVLTFDNGGDYLIIAYFVDGIAEIASLKPGDKVKFKGKYIGFIINDEDFLIPADIKFENCYLIEE